MALPAGKPDPGVDEAYVVTIDENGVEQANRFDLFFADVTQAINKKLSVYEFKLPADGRPKGQDWKVNEHTYSITDTWRDDDDPKFPVASLKVDNLHDLLLTFNGQWAFVSKDKDPQTGAVRRTRKVRGFIRSFTSVQRAGAGKLYHVTIMFLDARAFFEKN